MNGENILLAEKAIVLLLLVASAVAITARRAELKIARASELGSATVNRGREGTGKFRTRITRICTARFYTVLPVHRERRENH